MVEGIKTKMARNICIGLLLPILTYFFFWFYVPEDAWFWTMAVSIGLFLLFFSSPNHSIFAGLRLLPLADWVIIIAVPILFITLFTKEYKLEVRLMMGISFLIFGIGISALWRKLVRKIASIIKNKKE